MSIDKASGTAARPKSQVNGNGPGFTVGSRGRTTREEALGHLLEFLYIEVYYLRLSLHDSDSADSESSALCQRRVRLSGSDDQDEISVAA